MSEEAGAELSPDINVGELSRVLVSFNNRLVEEAANVIALSNKLERFETRMHDSLEFIGVDMKSLQSEVRNFQVFVFNNYSLSNDVKELKLKVEDLQYRVLKNSVGGFWPKRLMMDLILIVIVVLFLNFFMS